MASVTRRIRRMISRQSRTVPAFTVAELSKVPPQTRGELASAIAEVDPDHPLASKPEEPAATEAAPAPEVEAAPAQGTYCTTPDGAEHGPFKNQTEAKAAVREALGVARLPKGCTFTRK